MHFSLRTLLVVITATAVYVGFHLGMIRTFHGRTLVDAAGMFSMLYRLPLFVIWSVAAAHIYPQRRGLPYANFVLAAIALAFVWLLLSPIAQVVLLRVVPGSMQFLRWYGAGYAFVDGAVEAACWGLLLFAYVKRIPTANLPTSPLAAPSKDA